MNFFKVELLTYIKFFVCLFTIINPIGMIPIFVSLTGHQTSYERKATNIQANFIAMLILFCALFFGNQILNLFNISVESLRIAGGLLILTFSLSIINQGLLNNKPLERSNNSTSNVEKKSVLSEKKDVSIFPLAFPLIAGPGAISSVIAWRTEYSDYPHVVGFFIVIFLFSCFCWLIFKAAPYIVNFIDEKYITILNYIMSFLLLTVGIEFISNGIKAMLFSYI